jgi:hypothetical protein
VKKEMPKGRNILVILITDPDRKFVVRKLRLSMKKLAYLKYPNKHKLTTIEITKRSFAR